MTNLDPLNVYGTPDEERPPEHRINYGRLWPHQLFKADCTCGWAAGPDNRERVIAAVREHEDQYV